MKDYYEILEVHPKASSEIIKKAYQTLAKKYHPDITKLEIKVAAKKMSNINEAYKILSDPLLRKKYDDQYFNNTHEKNSNNTSDFVNEYNFICNLSKESINKIKEFVVHKTGYESTNKKYCDNISSAFEHDLANHLNIIENSNSNKVDVYNTIGFVYWKLACAYTWAQDFYSVNKYLDLADHYINRNAIFFKNFFHDYIAIKKDIRENFCPKDKSINDDTNNNKHKIKKAISHIIKFFWVYAFVIITIITIFSQPNSSSKNNSNSSNSPSAHQTAKKVEAIAKSDVKTQYVKDAPKLNDNGMCELTIDNSKNDMPVYVRIWDLSSNTPVRAFTIKKSSKFTAKDLTPGEYEVRYKELYENDVPSFGSKSEPITLEQYEVDDGIQYSQVSLTLYKVKNGNTKTSQIPLSDV